MRSTPTASRRVNFSFVKAKGTMLWLYSYYCGVGNDEQTPSVRQARGEPSRRRMPLRRFRKEVFVSYRALIHFSHIKQAPLQFIKNRLVGTRTSTCPKILNIPTVIWRLNKPGMLRQAWNAFKNIVYFSRRQLLALVRFHRLLQFIVKSARRHCPSTHGFSLARANSTSSSSKNTTPPHAAGCLRSIQRPDPARRTRPPCLPP